MIYQLQPATTEHDRAILHAIWVESQEHDDRGFRPRGGWWKLTEWARVALLLYAGDQPIGGLALNQAPDSALEARLALLPEWREPDAARQLVAAALEIACMEQRNQTRLTLPGAALWARRAAMAAGFAAARATLVMLRPASAEPLAIPSIPGISIRPLAAGEEGRALHALNHAWASTWNFRPLTRRALERDLTGQREGFLVAVDAAGRIAGTVHAQFDPAAHNHDGTPYAWISNLTTTPEARGRGLGRALLAAGIANLQQRGATSIMLGVDAGAPAPLALYRSAGFTEIDRLELWEHATQTDHGHIRSPQNQATRFQSA